MADIDTCLPELSALIEQRLGLLRRLAESVEVSQLALVRNDAEGIARGAAHQAELCRQWGLLEEQLRHRVEHPAPPAADDGDDRFRDREHSARLAAEWDALGARIRYLTRVHWSLLRHMQRSLAVLNRVVESCAPTYRPDPGCCRPEVGMRAGE